MLQVKNVTKIYGKKGGFKALDNVSIDFGSRGLVVVLGKSGCGKSTLLNIISGLDSATSGEVVINGRSTATFKTVDFDSYRNTFVGIVFQEFNLIDEITVYENINMTMKLQEKDADVNTVDEVLDMVGLSNLGYRKPGELSGGQRQRVAIARALLKKPEIILADEPTGALDSVTGEGVFETLKRIAQEKLVIVVTHNRDLAFGYADRIIELSDGKVIGDSMKDAETDKSVKELEGTTIEVSAGGKVTKEQLNKRLKKNAVNYIGLCAEKDRIALAYPETVEGFYDAPSTASFNKTVPENIPTDEKPFKLSKGKMKLKDSLAYARKGIKRSKKRYRFLMVVTSICFTFFSLMLIVSLVNTPSLISKSAFDAGSQPFVVVGAKGRNGYGSRKMTKDDVEITEDIMGESSAQLYYLSATPEFADSSQTSRNAYINGVLETDDISKFGLKTVAGKSKCETLSEIIISDYAAYMLCNHGYIGYDKGGKYSVVQPVTAEEIVGTKVTVEETGLAYDIVGVFETDYEKYMYAVTEMSGIDRKAEAIFEANEDYMYRKMFVAKGFTEQYRKDSSGSKGGERFNLTINNTKGDVSYWMSATEYSVRYDKSKFDGNMFWSAKKENGVYVAPDELQENEIVIGKYVLNTLTDENFASAEDAEQSLIFKKIIDDAYTLYVYSSELEDPFFLSEMKIVGVFREPNSLDEYYSEPQIMVGGDAISQKLHPKGECDALYFNKGFSASSLTGKFKTLDRRGFVYGTSVADYTSINIFTDLLKDFRVGFFVATVILFVLAFLTIFNYMSATVRFRTKEIAVYRVIGAKSSDIMRMFLVEGLFIVIVSSVVSIILSLLTSLLLNSMLSSVLSLAGIALSIVNFNWLINPLAIILGCTLIVTVSALLPISRITSKRPVEAVKLI